MAVNASDMKIATGPLSPAMPRTQKATRAVTGKESANTAFKPKNGLSVTNPNSPANAFVRMSVIGKARSSIPNGNPHDEFPRGVPSPNHFATAYESTRSQLPRGAAIRRIGPPKPTTNITTAEVATVICGTYLASSRRPETHILNRSSSGPGDGSATVSAVSASAPRWSSPRRAPPTSRDSSGDSESANVVHPLVGSANALPYSRSSAAHVERPEQTCQGPSRVG